MPVLPAARLADRWWTLAAPGYDLAVTLVGWHRWLDVLVADITSGVLLEVGCGPAYLSRGLLARGIGYVGVDRNAAMAARARRRAASTPGSGLVVRADVTALPFRGESFDIVVAAGVLGLLDLGSRQAALREMTRVTRGEVRLLEPVRRAGAPPRITRARLIGLVRDRPIDLAELAEAGLEPRIHGSPLLAGVYSIVHAARRLSGVAKESEAAGEDGRRSQLMCSSFLALAQVITTSVGAAPQMPASSSVSLSP